MGSLCHRVVPGHHIRPGDRAKRRATNRPPSCKAWRTVPLGICVELPFARLAAEIVRLLFVFGLGDRLFGIEFHAAHRILDSHGVILRDVLLNDGCSAERTAARGILPRRSPRRRTGGEGARKPHLTPPALRRRLIWVVGARSEHRTPIDYLRCVHKPSSSAMRGSKPGTRCGSALRCSR